MKKITLSSRQARILRLQLENKQDGYNLADLRKLDKKILPALESATADYDANIEGIVTRYRKLRADEKTNRDKLVEDQNAEIKVVDESLGEAEIVVDFEDADFDFLKGLWTATQGYLGNKDARQTIIAIDDAILNAVDGDPSSSEVAKKNE